MPYLISLWMVFAATGGGIAVLRILGLSASMPRFERVVVGFTAGVGMTGWLAFFPGVLSMFNTGTFAIILCLMSAGLVLLSEPVERERRTPAADTRLSLFEWGLIIGIILVGLMDVSEAMAPAADADTMAYHFETPRRYLAEGAIYAIPRALDGVTQLLLQMTYAMAMGLGGEKAALFWTMVTGWSLSALFFVLARHHMRRAWALAGALCLMSTPAVIYAAGSGQVEVRAAAFALLSAYACAMSASNAQDPGRALSWALLAGIVAGFLAGTKTTGLIFAFAACIALIRWQAPIKENLKHILAFSLAVGVCGFQWYTFNALQTGDPFYPLLWKLLPYKDGFQWDAAQAAALNNMWHPENSVSRSPLWFFAYPFRVIINPLASFEALRTGIGPITLICLPFASIAFLARERGFASPLFRMFLIAGLFYLVWFMIGPSLRIRHLIPVYPIVLLCLIAGVARFAEARPSFSQVLYAGFACVLTVQVAGQVVFTKKYIHYLLAGLDSTTFLEKNISGYPAVAWLNSHLQADDRALISNRDWMYRLNVPYFIAHPNLQTQILLNDSAHDDRLFAHQLAEHGITHIVMPAYNQIPEILTPFGRFMTELERRGCATQLETLKTPSFNSRTLPGMNPSTQVFHIYAVRPETCYKPERTAR